MGKRDKRVAFINPIAAARARGPAATSGPTIKDYLGRNRMSLEEAEEFILKTTKKPGGGSGSLASWEEELNDNYRKELKKAREKKMAEVAAPAFKKRKKDKKKTKKHARARSRSHSPSLSDSDLHSASSKKRKVGKGKRKKRKRHRHSSSDTGSDESGDESDYESSRRRKKKSSVKDNEDGTEVPNRVGDEPVEGRLTEVEGRKTLLPTPRISQDWEGEGEMEGKEGEGDAGFKRRAKPTKWTNKWDSK